jgi:DNA-binding FrmR family transcriptional regulator
MEQEGRKKIINRLKRIEGQIRGLTKLVENDASCLDILTQVSAVTAATKKAGTEVIRIYLDQCLKDTAGSKDAARMTKKQMEFHKALSRFVDMS